MEYSIEVSAMPPRLRDLGASHRLAESLRIFKTLIEDIWY